MFVVPEIFGSMLEFLKNCVEVADNDVVLSHYVNVNEIGVFDSFFIWTC